MFSKSRIAKSRFGLIGLMLVLLATASCIFEPRATQEPTDVGGSDVQPAQDPETVISNLVTIVYGNISGSYPDLFTEDFEFVPDPEDLDFINNQYGPGIYLDWFKPVEVSVADQLFDRLAKALLDLEEIDIAEQTDTTYVAYYEYKLDILPHGDTWRYYYGIAHLHLRLSPEDNFWYINRWDDFRPQDIPEDSRGTWGLLKGEIRATT